VNNIFANQNQNTTKMKNLLLLCSTVAFMLTSCSNDDNSSKEDTSILPKTISYTYPSTDLGTNSKSTVTYNGNKIVGSANERSKTIFTYTGNVIAKQEQFDIDSKGTEIKDIEAIYTYENGKLKTRITRESFNTQYPNGQYIEKTVYAYASNDLISYVNYSINPDTQTETKISEGSLNYKDGNLIKDQFKSGVSVSTRVYEYDNKRNPLKNILGFELLLNETECSTNNVLKTTRTDSGIPNSSVYLTNYIYNEKDYPLKQTSFTGDGKSIEYEVEYTY